MKRIYADLHLCLNSKDSKHVLQMISKASRLGYRLIATTFPPNSTEEEIWQLRNVGKEAKVDLVSRVDLKPRTPKELIYNLRKLRRKFEVIAVVCESKNVARQAAKDRRVDLLSFPSLDFRRRFFDRAEAELASNGLACFEIDVKPLLVLEGSVRVRFLSSLRREVAIAEEFHVPVVISSGVSDGMLLRKPRELAAFASLFDLGEVSALEAVSENPVAIVKRNRGKLSSRFVAPGIRVIRRGMDC
jgi:ribonuclease P/MRP protein subunit RPP1